SGRWADVPLPDIERGELLAAAMRTLRDRCPLRPHFRGRPGSGRHATAQALAGALGLPPLPARLSRLGGEAGDISEALLRVFREAALQDAVLCLDGVEDLPPTGSTALTRQLADAPGVVIIASGRDWAAPAGPPLGIVDISFLRPGPQVRRKAWAASLDKAGIAGHDDLAETLADRFRCGPAQIADAVATAVARARAAGTNPGRADLFAAARGQSTHLLSPLASRITPAHHFADLVLPADSMTQLREVCQRVILRERVWRRWGAGRPAPATKGTIALF